MKKLNTADTPANSAAIDDTVVVEGGSLPLPIVRVREEEGLGLLLGCEVLDCVILVERYENAIGGFLGCLSPGVNPGLPTSLVHEAPV